MHSSTTSYVTLQNLYKQQFQHDLAKFASLLAIVVQEAGLQPEAIPASEIESFVKNVSGVNIIKGSSILEAKSYEGGVKERISAYRLQTRLT